MINQSDIMDNEKINIDSADEIVIVVPEESIKDGEIEIDLDELGIDVESLGENVNIVIQVEGEEDGDLVLDDGTEVVIFDEDDDDEITEPNEWYFDDDPYEIVYYEFPDFDQVVVWKKYHIMFMMKMKNPTKCLKMVKPTLMMKI